MDMINAVMKATGSSEKDWKITKVPVDEAMTQGRAEVQKANYRGMLDVLYGINFKPGMGGDFSHKSDNGVLGLEEEDLDEVVERIVKEIGAKE